MENIHSYYDDDFIEEQLDSILHALNEPVASTVDNVLQPGTSNVAAKDNNFEIALEYVHEQLHKDNGGARSFTQLGGDRISTRYPQPGPSSVAQPGISNVPGTSNVAAKDNDFEIALEYVHEQLHKDNGGDRSFTQHGAGRISTRYPQPGTSSVAQPGISNVPGTSNVAAKDNDFGIAFDYVKDNREGRRFEQIGGGNVPRTQSPQPGPSRVAQPEISNTAVTIRNPLNYTIRKKSERTYAKNAAVDRSYQVKIDEEQNGKRFLDIRQGLHNLFDNVLAQARENHADNDLGRVVIHHNDLQDPIVVPLQPWSSLNADTVMGNIEKVLNSKQSLSVNDSFEVTVGSIDLPKGGAFRRITNVVDGKTNSLKLKNSIVTIRNDDQLCMARAIAVAWAKLRLCTPNEWAVVNRQRHGRSNVDLILRHGIVPATFYRNLLKKNRNEQKKLATVITGLAGIPLDRPASLRDIAAFENVLNVRVMVISARLGNKFVTGPRTDARPCIYIYLVDDNHFHAISSITGFFSDSYFCDRCLKHFSDRESHQCEVSCIVCKSGNCPKTDQVIICDSCNMTCRSDDCFKRHKETPKNLKGKHKNEERPLSPCKKWWKCLSCFGVINTKKRKITEHRCGEYLCKSCERYVQDDHLCYLRAIPCVEDHDSKFIFFDFECTQDQTMECSDGYQAFKDPFCLKCQPGVPCTACSICRNCSHTSCGKNTHKPNFVVAHTVCKACIDEPLNPDSVCDKCGNRCEECAAVELDKDAGPCPGICGFREIIFEGEDTALQFGQWLFSDQHKHVKAIAHNMKGYDGYFLLEYLIDQSMRPDKIIYAGSKIMYMSVERGLKIKVLDSLNFLPMSLSKLPKTFDLKELKKGWFPHLFNTRENQNYEGPYPNIEYYGSSFMKAEERNEFLVWYESKRGETFNFREEILSYCRSDVDILRQACLTFRHLLMSSTGKQIEFVNDKGKTQKKWIGAIDPFKSVTIASVCMNVYRTKFLEEEWRVKLSDGDEWVPAKRYDGKEFVLMDGSWVSVDRLEHKTVTEREFVRTPIAKISSKRLQYQYSKASIQWLEWLMKKDNIRIQHALNGGEITLIGTRYRLDGYCRETNTAYEYHGCVFHGCMHCFQMDREKTQHPLTGQSLSELFSLTQKKKNYIRSLGMRYVCIWEHQFVKDCRDNEELKRFLKTLDIVERLDPRDSFFGGRTNASRLYYQVKKNEQIRYVDFTSLYPWVNKYCKYPIGHPTIITSEFREIDQYFGIAKVKVLPPRGLYHPVLPYRSNGKLTFPLCKTCVERENQEPCECSNEERAITGTWVTPEIQTAVRLGYKILKIYEVYHWNETTQYDPTDRTGGLFADYINTFLKFKQEANGPPKWVKENPDLMDTYITQYFENEGVMLDRGSIVNNPGLRALAKLCLNSFWGKFGQRLNLRQTSFFHKNEANEFFKMFTDTRKEPHNFHIVAADTIQLEWVYKQDYLPEDNKTNVYLATFTTCWARLKLYNVLEALGRRCLYFDTDSVIYISTDGQYDPPLGDYLGQLTNEITDGSHIVEFVSGGPKNYAYKTSNGNECCKVRGFTLNFANNRLINFTNVRAVVTQPAISIINKKYKLYRSRVKRMLFYRKKQEMNQIRINNSSKRVSSYRVKRQINDRFEARSRKYTYQANKKNENGKALITKLVNVREENNVHRRKRKLYNGKKMYRIKIKANKICRVKASRKMYNRIETKTYQMVYTKRRRLANFDTLPYGY